MMDLPAVVAGPESNNKKIVTSGAGHKIVTNKILGALSKLVKLI